MDYSLGKITLLNTLEEQKISENLSNGNFKIISYKKNSVIHFADDICNKLEIILSGEVIVENIDESGNLLTVSKFSDNDILGGSLLFSKNPFYPMTVTTQSDTDILVINKEVLFDLFCHNPMFLREYLVLISDRAFILGNTIKHYVNKTIREKIVNYLNHEMKKQNSNCVKLNITKKALAERIGVQRTSLSRELAKMRKDGIIEFDAYFITILKN